MKKECNRWKNMKEECNHWTNLKKKCNLWSDIKQEFLTPSPHTGPYLSWRGNYGLEEYCIHN